LKHVRINIVKSFILKHKCYFVSDLKDNYACQKINIQHQILKMPSQNFLMEISGKLYVNFFLMSWTYKLWIGNSPISVKLANNILPSNLSVHMVIIWRFHLWRDICYDCSTHL